MRATNIYPRVSCYIQIYRHVTMSIAGLETRSMHDGTLGNSLHNSFAKLVTAWAYAYHTIGEFKYMNDERGFGGDREEGTERRNSRVYTQDLPSVWWSLSCSNAGGRSYGCRVTDEWEGKRASLRRLGAVERSYRNSRRASQLAQLDTLIESVNFMIAYIHANLCSLSPKPLCTMRRI